MKYFKVLFFLVISFINAQEKHFVTFISDEVQITHEKTFATVIIPFEILEGFHIQLEKVEEDNLIATKIDFKDQTGIEITNKEFTSLQYKTVVLDKKKFQVLDDTFKVKVKIKLLKEINHIDLIGKLFYQTCDDFKCYFPRELTVIIPIK